jgi:hypothetical protein
MADSGDIEGTPGDGTYPFINDTELMNVSTSGIGVGNNLLSGDNLAALGAADESFVVNPEPLLTKVKVFIDNSVGGYNTATENLYYRAFYADGTNSGDILVSALTSEAGGQTSFTINWDGTKYIDAVQLTMTRGSIKIPVIEFTTGTVSLANDLFLDFRATETDADTDKAESAFSVDLYGSELSPSLFDFALAGTNGQQDAFNIDLAASLGAYWVGMFNATDNDKLVLLGDLGAVFAIDNTGADAVVTVDETGPAFTTITAAGIDLVPGDVVLG